MKPFPSHLVEMLRLRHLNFYFSLGLHYFTQYFGHTLLEILLLNHFCSMSTGALCFKKQRIEKRFMHSISPLQGWRTGMR